MTQSTKKVFGNAMTVPPLIARSISCGALPMGTLGWTKIYKMTRIWPGTSNKCFNSETNKVMEDDRTRHVAFFLLLTVPLTDVKFFFIFVMLSVWNIYIYIIYRNHVKEWKTGEFWNPFHFSQNASSKSNGLTTISASLLPENRLITRTYPSDHAIKRR